MSGLTHEIVEHIGVLSVKKSGWKKELNLVSWNDGPEKFDIREWDPKHEKMGKGVTFTYDEMRVLFGMLREQNF